MVAVSAILMYGVRECANQAGPPALNLSVRYVDFDGDDLGTRDTSLSVYAFEGAEKIDELEAYPINFHYDPDAVKAQLIARGKRFEEHAGMHFRSYEGIALESAGRCMNRYNIDGRVVVDTKTFHRMNANLAFSVSAYKSEEEKRAKRRRVNRDDSDDEDTNRDTSGLLPGKKFKLDPLTDEQRLMTNATVRGFSFSEKRWLDFFLDQLSPIDWNPNCFDQLVLPEAQKDTVKALVSTHSEQKLGFDDIVKGKGKGLILVLHGPPGVGKTLTAETVAEYCKRPLYMVSLPTVRVFSSVSVR